MLYVVLLGLTTFSGSCRNGLTGDTSLATLLLVLVLSGYEWWCKQYWVKLLYFKNTLNDDVSTHTTESKVRILAPT